MIRDIKTSALALVVIVVLSAAVASTASAQTHNGKLTSTGNFILTGGEILGKVNALTVFGVTVKCPGSTYTGHKVAVTPHSAISSGAEAATITPEYGESCSSTLGPSAVDMNDCDYVLHVGETNGTADTYSVTYDVVCPAGKDITVTSWFSEAERKEGKEACVQHIAPQSGLTGGTMTDTTEGDLVLGGSAKVKAVQTKDGLHSLLCPAKEGTGELDLNVTVRADTEPVSETAVSLSDLAGGSGKLTSTGNFILTGGEILGKVNALTVFGVTVKCPGSTYTGHKVAVTPHSAISSGAEAATITPEYGESCSSTLGPSAVDMNDCDYVLHVGETNGTADTYSVTYDVVCPAGKDITVTSWFSEAERKEGKEACVQHIAPQSGLTGGTMTDTTEGDLVLGGSAKVKAVQTKDGLHSLLCPAKEGTGELDLNVTVRADTEPVSETAVSLSDLAGGSGKLTSTGNFILTGGEILGKVNALTVFGVTVKCPGSTYTGHKVAVTPHSAISSGAEAATITPEYGESCSSTLGPSAVDMNDCDYVLHVGETNGTADTYSVTYDVVCPAGKDITVTSWFSEAERKEGKEACVQHIAPQSGLTGGTMTDTTEGDLVLGGSAKVKAVQTKDGLHSLLCPAKEGTGELDLNVTVRADTEPVSETAVSLSHD